MRCMHSPSIFAIFAQTTFCMQQEAREIVHRFVNGYQRDIVLFVAHGVTGCVNKLVHLLGLRRPGPLFNATEEVGASFSHLLILRYFHILFCLELTPVATNAFGFGIHIHQHQLSTRPRGSEMGFFCLFLCFFRTFFVSSSSSSSS
jgi:hypothetical protein